MTKTQKSNRILNWLKDAGLKSAVILLAVAGGFYTYAAVSWPAAGPNPVTGVVGMFVGQSSAPYDATVSGYANANTLCSSSASYPGSHICTQDEMINSYNHGQPAVSAIYTYNTSVTLWINSGPPGFTSNANDCKGWTKTDSPAGNRNFGRVWNFQDKYGSLLDCSAGKAFACCL